MISTPSSNNGDFSKQAEILELLIIPRLRSLVLKLNLTKYHHKI